MISILEQIKNYPGSASIILPGITAWILYRIGVYNTRGNVLNSIDPDVDVHQSWLRTAWPEKRTKEIEANKDFFRSIVFKIETTGIESAITRGGNLFLNPDLIKSLVNYNQSISNLNQLINLYQNFISHAEIWDKTSLREEYVPRALKLYIVLHIGGIGGIDDTGAHTAYQSFRKEFGKEKSSKVLPLIWLLTGINLFRLKEWVCKYL